MLYDCTLMEKINKNEKKIKHLRKSGNSGEKKWKAKTAA